MIALKIIRAFICFLPFNKGKQTIAHYIYMLLFKDSKPQKVTIKKNEILYTLNLEDRIQFIFFLTNLYEPETVTVCAKILSSNSSGVYIDVGANVGFIALQLRSLFPKIQCHLFEPSPQVFKQLQHNVSTNQLTGITLNQKAVAANGGDYLTFHPSENSESGWGRLANSVNSDDPAKIQVATVSLDHYIHENKITDVDLLKIDVEGAELGVLTGLKSTLQKKGIKSIVCEINPEALKPFNTNPAELRAFFQKYGYIEKKSFDQNVLFESE